MTVTAPYRSALPAGRDGITRTLRAEWTKFRTVRGWMITTVAAALVTMLLGLLFAVGSRTSCSVGPVEVACPAVPLGPGGEAVQDRFFFANQTLTGDGSITARVTSMTGVITYPPPDHDKLVSGLVPWAKAGIMIKASAAPGSSYAAVTLTGRHGVRMQDDFTHDTAGRPGGVTAAAPRWLRLTRSGGTLTGYESPDGTRWTEIGTARPAALPATVRAGLFVTSPSDMTVKANTMGGSIVQARFTQASAVFDRVEVRGRASGAWRGDDVGDDGGKTDWERYHRPSGLLQAGGTLTVTGSGDIAPSRDGVRVESTLTGVVLGLILVIVVAVMFVTAEYRRGLIRTTLLAEPRRGRVLAAKAAVAGAVAFVTGLTAGAVAVPLSVAVLRAGGNHVLPVSPLTEVRVVAGVAALFAATAVLAVALGALYRRSVAAVTTGIVLLVVPYVIATASVLPDAASEWLTRLSPAAGFAILQSIPEYAHVTGHYTPSDGYYPLAPWAGMAVLCLYAALALGLAVTRLRRRDA
ncbi:DUF1349 domain-containing protein [Sphaerisporangium corydalis]|uniref:DUF1349 domain-containing protein n=1 Tax=Sphaerisporangium corydalis TaxID=1441875 RepID=A0ABV9E9C9_9ACTN|nr:DUF1349 domain-containing protein [Sphaerisporangium corydalis]